MHGHTKKTRPPSKEPYVVLATSQAFDAFGNLSAKSTAISVKAK